MNSQKKEISYWFKVLNQNQSWALNNFLMKLKNYVLIFENNNRFSKFIEYSLFPWTSKLGEFLITCAKYSSSTSFSIWIQFHLLHNIVGMLLSLLLLVHQNRCNIFIFILLCKKLNKDVFSNAIAFCIIQFLATTRFCLGIEMNIWH